MVKRTKNEAKSARDEHGLGLAVTEEAAVGLVSNGEDVGSELLTTLASVQLDHVVGVDGEEAVGVDGDAEEARVGLEKGTVSNGTKGQGNQNGQITRSRNHATRKLLRNRT